MPMGIQKPYAYKVVKGFLVSNGKGTDIIDHSKYTAVMRMTTTTMKKVCIVGASGKLGQYMVQHALDRGY